MAAGSLARRASRDVRTSRPPLPLQPTGIGPRPASTGWDRPTTSASSPRHSGVATEAAKSMAADFEQFARRRGKRKARIGLAQYAVATRQEFAFAVQKYRRSTRSRRTDSRMNRPGRRTGGRGAGRTAGRGPGGLQDHLRRAAAPLDMPPQRVAVVQPARACLRLRVSSRGPYSSACMPRRRGTFQSLRRLSPTWQHRSAGALYRSCARGTGGRSACSAAHRRSCGPAPKRAAIPLCRAGRAGAAPACRSPTRKSTAAPAHAAAARRCRGRRRRHGAPAAIPLHRVSNERRVPLRDFAIGRGAADPGLQHLGQAVLRRRSRRRGTRRPARAPLPGAAPAGRAHRAAPRCPAAQQQPLAVCSLTASG